MKRWIMMIGLIAAMAAQPSYAKDANVVAHISGLVCDFCAHALEKVFSKNDNVDRIEVDLNDSVTRIWLREDKSIDNATVTKLIEDAGYNVESIER